MSEALIVIDQQSPAIITQHRGNYQLAIPNGTMSTLQRNVDFGNPVTKSGKNAFPQPILYKGGAEKIIKDYKVFPHYVLDHCEENAEIGYFFYRFICELRAYDPNTGNMLVIQEGFGSSNTRETKGGNQSGFDGANSALKNARKRAMVDAAISLAGLSSVFTQDIENESFMNGAYDVVQAKEDEPISSKQRQRVFSIAATKGMSNEQCKTWLKAAGFVSVKDILQKDYDGLCEKLEAVE